MDSVLPVPRRLFPAPQASKGEPPSDTGESSDRDSIRAVAKNGFGRLEDAPCG